MGKASARYGSARANMCFMMVLSCFLLLGGCALKPGGGSQAGGFAVSEDDSTASLSRTELAALQSSGQIDKNIPSEAMSEVTRQYKYFLRKGRSTISASSRRAEQYLTHARKVFRSRGMPEDLACLAIVESGYRSDVKSPVGAAGAWQFMPYTGQKYGLTQDWWTDERLDPFEATEAAADYLQKLYGDFGDWPTAIAAYNAGEGKMSRAMQGTGGRNFFEARSRNHMLSDKAQLREETKQYVPRFLAVTKIMRNLPQLGFDAIQPESAPTLLRLAVRPGTDLMGIARACRMDWEEFVACNKHHKQRITDTGRSTFVYVPARHERAVLAFLVSPEGTAYAGWGAAKVASGADSWEKISRRCGVSVARLREVNPGVERLRAGQTVLAPRSVDMSGAAVAALDARPAKAAPAGKPGKGAVASSRSRPSPEDLVHTLQANESLSAVASKYKVGLKEIQEYNQIADPHKVRAGLALRIPGRGEAVASAGPSRLVAAGADGRSAGRRDSRGAGKAPRSTHTVQARDSLWKIARDYNVSVEDLKRWNSVDEKSLRVGAALVVAQ